MNFDVNKIRQDFPILKQKIYDKPLVYLDNAATTQKPSIVIDTISKYYSGQNSNVHRGMHYLSMMATDAFENSRKNIADFINAKNSYEIIFTTGTTESVNLVAYSYGRKFISEGENIIISAMEHHSNIVPWQILCEEKGAKLSVIPINEEGEIDFEAYEKMLTENTGLVAITHVSNALGTVNPIKKIIDLAHNYDVPVLIDGAQGISHLKVDVKELDCDFYCFSAHKMYGPMGIGILYGKEKYLEKMLPYKSGGEMIAKVTFEKTTFNELPYKFEAGTPNVAGVLGFDAAIKYLTKLSIKKTSAYETDLFNYATSALQEIEGLRIIGTAKEKISIISFLLGDIHPFDAGTIIDKTGIAVRTGHHCAEPLMDRYQIPGTIRASFVFYNTKQEVDSLIKSIHVVKNMFE